MIGPVYLAAANVPNEHVRDIISLLLAQGPRLDYKYIDAWARRLRLQTAWQTLLAEARARGAQLP